MKSQTDMMNYLGGIPVAMSYGDVYTSLQTGIIDGTENNETALTTGKHGEVCKVYSVDQHAMIPDVLIMSEKVWKQISPEDQEIILEAAHNSTEAHKVMWDTANISSQDKKDMVIPPRLLRARRCSGRSPSGCRAGSPASVPAGGGCGNRTPVP